MNRNRGFTLMELLVVIAIIGILGSIVVISVSNARQKAYFSRSLAEFNSLSTALELFKDDNEGAYPDDADRNIPNGLEAYLSTDGNWPTAPWPGSVYDWDNWDDPDEDDDSIRIYQISIRFCPVGGNISTCNFPDEDWAENFGVNSSVYYCIEGSCRAHINQNIDYPGYCVNC